jgi:glutathione synthase/RimK-type ligase-like ATP-grasp enzyme
MKIAFATMAPHPEIEDDDRPLAESLVRRGAFVISMSWDDATFDWSRIDVVLLRSPWDYYRRYDEFLAWLKSVEAQTRIVNPADIVRWNSSKRYMNELAAKGVHSVPTAFVARNEVTSLERLCADRGWTTVVLKPAVSADSWETIRVEPARYAEGQSYLERHRPEREILVQPFVKDVDEGGEQCLIFFGGSYSHAVIKNSAFKGGRHVGPEGRAIEPKADAIEMACGVLVTAGFSDVPYARVDLARDDAGQPLLLELELFEPTLFFKEKPGSEELLAEILLR